MQVTREIPFKKPTMGGSFLWANLERYPLYEKQSAKRLAIEEDCKRQLRETGIALLPEFVNEEGLRRIIDEARSLIPMSFHSHVTGNAYLSPCDNNFPPDHTINLTESTSLRAIAYDQIPKCHALRDFYECDHLMDFISSSLVRHEKLFRYADPMGALNISVMKDGDYLRWHFDQTDFVVSICLQNADVGGDFEYVPFIRSASNEHYEKVKRVIKGDRADVKKVTMEPGTLVFFSGRHSLHRVTPIMGSTPRLMALLGFDTRSDTKSSEHLHYMRYGRTILG